MELLAGERKENETDRSVQACNDYLRLGSGRSIEKLHRNYTESTSDESPSKSLRWLAEWSRKYDWVQRASAYDAEIDASKTAEVQRLRTEGLAADYERLRELDSIYQALKGEFNGGLGIWFTDIKMSAKGDTVDVPVFNKPLIDSMRGVLDDIAKEVGGRKIIQEHSGPGGKPQEHVVKHDLSQLPTDELKLLRNLIAKTVGGNAVTDA